MIPDALMPFVLAAGVTASLLCLVAAFSGRKRRLDHRIQKALRTAPVKTPARPAGSSIRLAEASGPFVGLERLAARILPDLQGLRDRLSRTGRPISLGAYVAACLATGMATAVAALAAGQGGVPALAAGLAGGVLLPHLAVGFLVRRRERRFLNLFPDAIDLIVRGLRSGLPVSEQIGAVGEEIADPVGSEFRRAAQAMRFGQTLEDALWETARGLGLIDFKFFVVCLAIQRETGGNLAETLQNLSDVLRRRRQMRLKIKAMSAEASASAVILGSMPFLMLGLLMLLNYDYASLLFTDPRGRMMLAGGLFLQFFGVFVMTRMVRFEI